MSAWVAPGVLLLATATLLGLGVGSQVLLRLCVSLYPKGHPRREELLAEAAHVKKVADIPAHLFYLGGLLAVALLEGVPERVRKRPASRQEAQTGAAEASASSERAYQLMWMMMDGGTFPQSVLRELADNPDLLEKTCSPLLPEFAAEVRAAVEVEAAQGALW